MNTPTLHLNNKHSLLSLPRRETHPVTTWGEKKKITHTHLLTGKRNLSANTVTHNMLLNKKNNRLLQISPITIN